MIALIRKELRELALPAAGVVALAAVVLAGSMLYGRHHQTGSTLAAGIWVVVALLVAFIGGAAAIAREPRERSVFVHAWPISAGCIWLAKTLVSLVVTFVSIGLGFLICLSGANFAASDVAHSFGDPATRGQIAGAVALAFACGLMWSGLIGSTFMAAVLGLVTAVISVTALALYLGNYLRIYWGPYVGCVPASSGFMVVVALLLSVLALMAGAAAFVAYPPLELRRRTDRGVAVFAGLLVLLAAGLTVWQVAGNRPSPRQPVEKAYLADQGRSILMRTYPFPTDPGGFWRLPLSGGEPHLIARGGPEAEGWPWQPHVLDGPVLLEYGPNSSKGPPTVWGVNMGTGRVFRLKSEPDAASPDGRLWTVAWHGQLIVQNERGKIVAKLGPDVRRGLIAPDSRRVYTEGKGTIAVVDLPSGQRTVLATFGGDAVLSQVSPDGRFLIALTAHKTDGPFEDTVILDLQTGRQQRFPHIRALPYGLVDGRYQWCQPVSLPINNLLVLDLHNLRTVNAIAHNFGSGTMLWHQPGLKHCLLTVQRRGQRKPGARLASPVEDVWLANPDGSGLRFLRQEKREVLGLAADGTVVLWDRDRGFIRWDPLTNAEAIIYEARDARLVLGGGA
ncbi:MAG: hypothetical protein KKI08_27035 [Armatimonadetes bacterium]|nr:hypothetical protein [Armatimonadota bacterium]